MKRTIALLLLPLLSLPAFADDAQIQTGATAGTAPSPSVPPVVIERPLPQGAAQPRLITRPETEADAAIRKQADTAITARAEDVASDCNAQFGARIDWTNIAPQEIHMANPENNCGVVLDALDQICATSAGRARVVPAIKSVICTAGPRPSLALHAGTLLYTLDWQSENPGAFAYAWLAAHL